PLTSRQYIEHLRLHYFKVFRFHLTLLGFVEFPDRLLLVRSQLAVSNLELIKVLSALSEVWLQRLEHFLQTHASIESTG
ncbi:MAG: hypothetical protein ACK55I_11990, partial [bacterium]